MFNDFIKLSNILDLKNKSLKPKNEENKNLVILALGCKIKCRENKILIHEFDILG